MMKFRGFMESSPNLGALSISSLQGTETNIDDASVDDDFDATAALYQRLHDLEQMTQSFLNERPIRLNDQHDSFTDVDKGSKQDFELEISEFLHEQVLCLSIFCIPETVNDESMYILDEAPKVLREHQPLDILLHRISSTITDKAPANGPIRSLPNAPASTDVSFTPSLHNGEYSYALTSAAGLSPGLYRLSIHNIGFATQPIRVTQKVLQEVRATPVRPGQKVIGCNGANEFTFYRFTSASPTQLITIKAKPIMDESNSPMGDPDLYVTNRYNGLVAVNKENFVWKSTNVGADRVDIHPRDIDMARGGTFVIGILGYKDRNEFEVEVSVSEPRPIRQLEVGESIEVSLSVDDPKYFSLRVDSTSKARLFMTVTPLSNSIFASPSRGGNENISHYNKAIDTFVDDEVLTRLVSQSYGRCVYACDGLSAYGLLEKSNWQDPRGLLTGIPAMPSIIKAQSMSAENVALFAAAIPQALPPSLCLDRGVFPVAYMSSGCMYPSPDDFSWRGSGADGNILVMFESDEWRYTAGNCYIALSSVHTPKTSTDSIPASSPAGKTPDKKHKNPDLMSPNGTISAALNCRVTLWESSALDRLSTDAKERYDTFQRVFRDIDGSNISQRERSRVGREDQALTYGEVEFLSFLDILRVAGASHGDVFYDLGCGAGKAVVAAALSGIKFLRCVGLELLPGLCVLAKDATVNLKNSLKTGGKSSDSSARELPPMEIREADILVADWSAADVVYISSICFSDSFIQSIFEKSKALKPGSKFITLKLPGSLDGWFEVDSQAWYKMTWGRIMVYVLRRTAFRGD